MKKLFNIILIIVLFSIVLVVYFNMDSIINTVKTYFAGDKKVMLKEPNKYKRDYTYLKYNNYSKEEDYIPHNKKDLEEIIYNVLNNGYKTFTFYCPEEYKTCENDVEVLSNDKVTLSGISNYVSPYNSYRNISTKMYVDGKVDIIVEKNYNEEEINKTNAEIENVSKKLGLDSMSKRKMIETVHDYILNNSDYDKTRSESGQSEYSSNKAIGPLYEKYAICSGYADSMALFLDKYSIPNIKVASNKHVWNLVYLDGKWLNLDLTWDLPLKGEDEINHTFLLINTAELEKLDTTEHNFDKTFYLEAK